MRGVTVARGGGGRVAGAVGKGKVGGEVDASTGVGAVSWEGGLEAGAGQVGEAVRKGGTRRVGGKRVESRGDFFEPTFLTHLTRHKPAYFDECFGPAAAWDGVKADDEAVTLANDSHYGLGGAVVTQRIERAKRRCSRLEPGMVYN
ncbi:aldehyde dehydrogenase family protein, partial [Salmonella enterica]|uniref:aldehyde dehydrogenase family protein n=1 Tax=Salmonella enterica TaxID=28901 RepID=UPI00398C76A6